MLLLQCHDASPHAAVVLNRLLERTLPSCGVAHSISCLRISPFTFSICSAVHRGEQIVTAARHYCLHSLFSPLLVPASQPRTKLHIWVPSYHIASLLCSFLPYPIQKVMGLNLGAEACILLEGFLVFVSLFRKKLKILK